MDGAHDAAADTNSARGVRVLVLMRCHATPFHSRRHLPFTETPPPVEACIHQPSRRSTASEYPLEVFSTSHASPLQKMRLLDLMLLGRASPLHLGHASPLLETHLLAVGIKHTHCRILARFTPHTILPYPTTGLFSHPTLSYLGDEWLWVELL